jgi:uncharacterized protein (UPF0212 family)
MSLRTRLDEIEQGIGAGACPACRRLPDGRFTLPLPRMLIDGGAIRLDVPHERCPTCGLPPMNLDLSALLTKGGSDE